MINPTDLKDGDYCHVTAGTHKGKQGTVRDINLSKTGHITITVVQPNGDRFKTLGRNVEVIMTCNSTGAGWHRDSEIFGNEIKNTKNKDS